MSIPTIKRENVMKKVIAVVMLIAVAVGGGMLTARAFRKRAPIKPFVVTFRSTDYDATGKGVLAETATRWRSASGAWHESRTYTNGKVDEIYGDPTRGTFVLKGDKLFTFSDTSGPSSAMDTTEMRKSESYLRDDIVAGVPVIVFKVEPSGSEVSVAPSLGITLRLVVREKDFTRVREAISVETKEPALPVPPVPNLPADRRQVESRQGTAQPPPQ
jgi:hypothetical protein